METEEKTFKKSDNSVFYSILIWYRKQFAKLKMLHFILECNIFSRQEWRAMSKKIGYRTITYRFRLYCDHMYWIAETKQMYNRVLAFYYDVIGKEPDIWDVPKLQMMRQLELLTVGSREDEAGDTKYPMPYEKVPLYFRRAAINDAIRLRGSLRTGEENGMKPAEHFDASPIYYKGMYKEFTSTFVRLKLFNGDKWVWEDLRQHLAVGRADDVPYPCAGKEPRYAPCSCEGRSGGCPGCKGTLG